MTNGEFAPRTRSDSRRLFPLLRLRLAIVAFVAQLRFLFLLHLGIQERQSF